MAAPDGSPMVPDMFPMKLVPVPNVTVPPVIDTAPLMGTVVVIETLPDGMYECAFIWVPD